MSCLTALTKLDLVPRTGVFIYTRPHTVPCTKKHVSTIDTRAVGKLLVVPAGLSVSAGFK